MATVIRLTRGGAKKAPYYRVVAADSRAPRDGNFIEKLGTFNPLVAKDSATRFTFNEERVKYWLSVGAQPSDRVARLLSAAGVVAKPDYTGKPQKGRKKPEKLTRTEKAEKAQADAKVKAEAEAQAAKEAAAAEAQAAKEAAAAEAAAPAAEAPAAGEGEAA